MAYKKIGDAHFRLGNIDSALEYLLKAVPLFEIVKSAHFIGTTSASILNIYLEKDNLMEAEKYLEILKQMADESQMKSIHERHMMSEALLFMKSSDLFS